MTQACPASQDGELLVGWIETVSGSCVYGPVSALSWVAGNVSLLAWLGAQLPQVVVNYMHHSVEGLSLGFLISWFIGDGTNFLGSLLTHQMPFQIVLGLYYCFIDTILGCQYWYYTRIKPPTSSSSDDQPTSLAQKLQSFSSGSQKLLASATAASLASRASAAPMPTAAPFPHTNASQAVGVILSWICTFMYLTSRIPQIRENYHRKSTWGTSILLFLSALTGNITYTISILTSPDARGANSAAFLKNELPFLIGSAGTVVFDLTIFFQYFYYGNTPTTVLENGIVYHHVDQHHDNRHHHDPAEHAHHQYPDFSLFHSSARPIDSHYKDDETPYRVVGTPTPASSFTPLASSHKPIYGSQ